MPSHTRRRLQCTAGCPPGRFEALNAPVTVDVEGGVVEIDDHMATYVCTSCRSVAIDLAAAGREMRESDTDQPPATLTCPSCATEMLPPDDDPLASLVECPVCGLRFTPDEGRPRLLGDGPHGDPELN